MRFGFMKSRILHLIGFILIDWMGFLHYGIICQRYVINLSFVLKWNADMLPSCKEVI